MVMFGGTGGSTINSLCGLHQTFPMGYQLPGHHTMYTIGKNVGLTEEYYVVVECNGLHWP